MQTDVLAARDWKSVNCQIRSDATRDLRLEDSGGDLCGNLGSGDVADHGSVSPVRFSQRFLRFRENPSTPELPKSLQINPAPILAVVNKSADPDGDDPRAIKVKGALGTASTEAIELDASKLNDDWILL